MYQTFTLANTTAKTTVAIPFTFSIPVYVIEGIKTVTIDTVTFKHGAIHIDGLINNRYQQQCSSLHLQAHCEEYGNHLLEQTPSQQTNPQ